MYLLPFVLSSHLSTENEGMAVDWVLETLPEISVARRNTERTRG